MQQINHNTKNELCQTLFLEIICEIVEIIAFFCMIFWYNLIL